MSRKEQTMTNEEAVEILYRELGTETEDKLFPEVIEARDMAVNALQEQIVWHPYPKEKPTDVGEYFVTIDGKVTIEDATYYEYSGTYQFDSQGVIAWAEAKLPKPYEEGEEDETSN